MKYLKLFESFNEDTDKPEPKYKATQLAKDTDKKEPKYKATQLAKNTATKYKK